MPTTAEAPPTGEIMIRSKSGATTIVAADEDTNRARGEALLHAVNEVADEGDMILVGPGDYEREVDEHLLLPKDSSLIGAGGYRSMLGGDGGAVTRYYSVVSTTGNMSGLVILNGRNAIRDLVLDARLGKTALGASLGEGKEEPWHDLILDNVALLGNGDVAWMFKHGGDGGVNITNCYMYAKYDGWRGDSDVVLQNVRIDADASSGLVNFLLDVRGRLIAEGLEVVFRGESNCRAVIVRGGSCLSNCSVDLECTGTPLAAELMALRVDYADSPQEITVQNCRFRVVANASHNFLSALSMAGNAHVANVFGGDLSMDEVSLADGATVQAGGTLGVPATAADPQDATAADRPRGFEGQFIRYAGDVYICTNAATPEWKKITTT